MYLLVWNKFCCNTYPKSFDNLDGDKSFRCVSSVLLTGDTSREDDRLAVRELTSTFKGRPNEGVEPPLPDFSGDVEEADIGSILAGESFFCSGT